MRIFYTPTQDASIYSQFPKQTTGLDEQIEVGKTNDGIDIARGLIQFDVPTISASISNGTISPTASFDLILYASNITNLQAGQTVELRVVSQSWSEGTGYFYQDNIQIVDGATWQQRSSGSLWAVTGSATMSIGVSQNFGVPAGDLTFDVTPIMRSWISGTYPNNGLLVKFLSADEANPINLGNAKFFSKDTHTIYLPTLVVKWNDRVYSTGSLVASPTSSLLVVPGNLKATYRQGETVRVDLYIRERYPLKTFTDTFSTYDGQRYLPTSSFYSIIDEQSGTTIIPFDDKSYVSVDPSNSYIKFKIQNMYPRRYYRVLIKVIHDGIEEIFDDGYIFTIK